MPKSSTRTPSGIGVPRSRAGHLDAEAVVAEEDVADPRHEDARASREQGFELVGREVEVAALPLELGRGGVVVEGDGDMVVAVDVAEHTRDLRGPTGQEEVVRVGPPRRAQPDGGALADQPVADPDGVGGRVDGAVDARVPPGHRIRSIRARPLVRRTGTFRATGAGGRTGEAERLE